MLIAEVGQNHCGDMELARELIRQAKENGADLVKFQLYDHQKLYSHAPYIPNVELSFDQAKMLFDYGKEIETEVFFSVFDLLRINWCEEIGVNHYKIAYSQRNNLDLIQTLYKTRKHVIMSGSRIERHMTGWDYLYCVPYYPTELKYLYFDANVFSYDTAPYWDGFSDHTIGIDVAKIALARGASVIEKHFAISHKQGIDAPWSMIPEELKELKRFEEIVKKSL